MHVFASQHCFERAFKKKMYHAACHSLPALILPLIAAYQYSSKVNVRTLFCSKHYEYLDLLMIFGSNYDKKMCASDCLSLCILIVSVQVGDWLQRQSKGLRSLVDFRGFAVTVVISERFEPRRLMNNMPACPRGIVIYFQLCYTCACVNVATPYDETGCKARYMPSNLIYCG